MASISKQDFLKKMSLIDAKLEVVLAELIEQDAVHLDDIVICPQGLFQRAHSNDVLSVEFKPPKHYKKELAFLKISREGFYDKLPQALFHLKKGRSGYKDVDAMIASSRYESKEEKEARLFFLPFEQELFRKKIDLEKEERNLLFGITEKLQPAFFDSYWNQQLRNLDFRTKSVLFFLLPLAHHLAGDRKLTGGTISAILGEKVQIQPVYKKYTVPEEFENIVLGNMQLNVDAVLGETFEDGICSWEIQVNDVEINSIPRYLEGGQQYILMQLIESYFTPAEVDVTWEVNLKESVNKFVLTENEAHGRLGYSTVV